MRLRHLSPRTQEAYLRWMRRYYEFHGRRNPAELGAEHVTAFLSHLATDCDVADAYVLDRFVGGQPVTVENTCEAYTGP